MVVVFPAMSNLPVPVPHSGFGLRRAQNAHTMASALSQITDHHLTDIGKKFHALATRRKSFFSTTTESQIMCTNSNPEEKTDFEKLVNS